MMPNVPVPTTSNPFGYCYHSDPFVKVTLPDLPEPEPHFDLTHQVGICEFFDYMKMELEKMLYSSGFCTAITIGNIVLSGDNESYDPFKMKVKVPIELDPSKLTIEEMEKAQDILTTKVMYLCNKYLYGHCCAYMKFDVKCEVTIKAPPQPIEIKLDYNENKEENTMMTVPEVKEIIHRTSKRGEFFTVKWADNTQTTVKRMEGDVSDEYTAFLYALGKKLFGDKGAARKYITDKKQVFETRVEKEAADHRRQRREAALEQSLRAEGYEPMGDDELSAVVYAQGMVPAALFMSTGRPNRLKKASNAPALPSPQGKHFKKSEVD